MSSSEEPSATTPSPVPESSSTTATATATTPPTTTTPVTSSSWQAIFAPQYNTYYFYNSLTQETTWINPLQPEPEPETQPETQPEASTSASASTSSTTPTPPTSSETEVDSNATAAAAASTVSSRYASLQAAAVAQGIDPLLAHLDPSLLASPSVPGSSGGINDPPSFTAKFNSRTGQYTPASSRTPGHLSEHERAKRMSEFYFDVGKWEEDLAKRGGSLMAEEDAGGEGYEGTKEKKRKRPSKKDLDRFKEQKRLKKIAKTAWLRT